MRSGPLEPSGVRVIVSAAFDDLRSPSVRFLHEASRLGGVHVQLWSDAAVERETGAPPRFPQEERKYLVEAIQYVSAVTVVSDPCDAPDVGADQIVYLAAPGEDGLQERCSAPDREWLSIAPQRLTDFPPHTLQETLASRPKVVVTGCYDWLHSGHVRFFEEAAEYGDLYVIVGSDANVRLLKGEGHPQFSEQERCYMVGAIRHVHRAMISTGRGWLDAEPEIAAIRPDLYIVNEDGDRPEKRAFCESRGIEYRVLRRLPREGLPRRQSTDLRGF